MLTSLGCSSSDDDAPQDAPGLEDGGTDGKEDAAVGEDGGEDTTDAGADADQQDAGDQDGGDEDAGEDASTPEPLAEKVVGSAGGTVEADLGVSIEIPEGALSEDVTITIHEVVFPPPATGGIALGKTFEFGPKGQSFAKPVTVKLPWFGPDNVPVEIAHSSDEGASWTTLTANADFDATHVWADTSSFSWFQPVLYQGAPDSPIVLNAENPTGLQKLVARGSTPTVLLRGTGFRGDTVVTLFKDEVTTTTLSKVTLTKWGLELAIPAEFTAKLGLITIEAKNPAAAVGDSAAVYVVETPVLQSLSPSTIDIPERDDNDYEGVNIPIQVVASDLPDDFSYCEVWISKSFGDMAVLVADTTAPSKTDGGFIVTATNWHDVTGTSELELNCGGVNSNSLPITFNKVPQE